MLLDGAVPPPVQAFALPSAEVQDIPVCAVSRPVDLPLESSTATWCSTHPFEICATCKPEGASVPSSRSLAKALNSTRPRWWMHSAFEHGPTKEQCTGVKKRVFTCAVGCHLPSKPLCPAVIPALVGRSSKCCKKHSRLLGSSAASPGGTGTGAHRPPAPERGAVAPADRTQPAASNWETPQDIRGHCWPAHTRIWPAGAFTGVHHLGGKEYLLAGKFLREGFSC